MKNKPGNVEQKKTCFVITPIGPDNSVIRRSADGVIESVIKPVLEGAGYIVEAAHHLSTPGSITEQVIQRIISSDVLIANLTTLNANVMYELAVRHCLGKPVISIVEDGTVLPFDISDERTIFFFDDMAGVQELKLRLTKAIESIADAPIDNPVSRAARANVFNVSPNNDDKESVIFDSIQRLENMVGRLANQFSSFEAKGNVHPTQEISLPASHIASQVLTSSKKMTLNEWMNYKKRLAELGSGDGLS